MGDENLMGSLGSVTLGTLGEAQRGQGTLRSFASETGGVSVVGTNDIATGFKHIVDANSSYYVLGYVPAASLDGLYHRITVGVKPRDLDVNARKGYFAVSDEAAAKGMSPAAGGATPSVKGMTPQMRMILASQLPVSGLALRATGGVLRVQHDGMLVSLVVEIDTSHLPFIEQNGQLSNDLELGYVALDSGGKVHAGSHSVGNLRLAASEKGTMANRLRYVAEFVVPSGHYQIRVGVHESAGDESGSAILDVDKPQAPKGALAMGAVVLTAVSAPSVPTTGTYPVVKTALSTPPTARREFTSQDTLDALVYLFEPSGNPGIQESVDVVTIVRTAQGAEVFRTSTTKRREDFDASTKSCPYVSIVPLKSFDPGAYELALEAHGPNNATTSKSIAFEIHQSVFPFNTWPPTIC